MHLHGYIIFYCMIVHLTGSVQFTLLPVMYEEALFPHSLVSSASSSFLISAKPVSEKNGISVYFYIQMSYL